MEKLLASTISIRHKFFQWGMTLEDNVSTFLPRFQFLINWVLAKHKAWTTKELLNASKVVASKGEIKTVMARLGMVLNKEEGDKLQESYDASELSRLFELEEPSLEELKEAFDIFDENKDGFMEASDLQRVLCCLGFKEGSQEESCRRMSGAVQRVGEGRIDFGEFVMFMEKCFC